MTISELIDKLQQYPAGMRVLVDGYEGDYDDIAKISSRDVYIDENWANDRNRKDNNYFGRHVGIGDSSYPERTIAPTEVLIICR